MMNLLLVVLALAAYFIFKAYGLRAIDAETIPEAIDAESEEL